MLTNVGMPRSSALVGVSSKWTLRWTRSSGGCWPEPRFTGMQSVRVGGAGQGRRAGAEFQLVALLATHHSTTTQQRHSIKASLRFCVVRNLLRGGVPSLRKHVVQPFHE